MDGAHAPGARPRRHPPAVVVRPSAAPGAGGLQGAADEAVAITRRPVWAIWGLDCALRRDRSHGLDRRRRHAAAAGVLVQVISAWIVMSSSRARQPAHRRDADSSIRTQQHTHRATLGEIEQLQTQNAMLEIIARSVDVSLAFQALASQIARLVPCDRVGLALLTENGQEFQTYTARVHEDERRVAAAARDRLQGRSDRARQRRPLARGADRPRHRGPRRPISSTPTSCTRRASARR